MDRFIELSQRVDAFGRQCSFALHVDDDLCHFVHLVLIGLVLFAHFFVGLVEGISFQMVVVHGAAYLHCLAGEGYYADCLAKRCCFGTITGFGIEIGFHRYTVVLKLEGELPILHGNCIPLYRASAQVRQGKVVYYQCITFYTGQGAGNGSLFRCRLAGAEQCGGGQQAELFLVHGM